MTKRPILAAAAAAVTLTACGAASTGTAAPRVLPPVTHPVASTSSSPAPSSEEAAVEAAVLNYFAAENVALSTGQVGYLNQLSLMSCGCRALSAQIHKDWAAGRIEDARVVIQRVRLHDLTSATAGAEIWGRVTAYRRVLSNGSLVESSQGGQINDDISLVNSARGWRISEIVNLLG